jgi:hypothetical protein
MKRWTLTLLAIVAVAMLGVALAQEVIPPVDLDPRTWFGNPFALAGVVLAFTGFIRAQLNTHGLVTLAISFGSGIALALGPRLICRTSGSSTMERSAKRSSSAPPRPSSPPAAGTS